MNFKKGLFRLTLVLSISVGIISSFVLIEREPYTKYKVKRTGGQAKEMALTEERRQQLDGIVQKMIENKESDANIQAAVNDFKNKYGSEKVTTLTSRTVTFLWEGNEEPDEADFIKIFLNAEKLKEKKRIYFKSPIVAPDREALLAEVRRRGLVPFTIIHKAVNPIKWVRFFLSLAIGFTSIWFIYALVRWVIIGFIIEGFKYKESP